jgi:hypothetical protein
MPETGLRDCAMYETGRETGFLTVVAGLSEIE